MAVGPLQLSRFGGPLAALAIVGVLGAVTLAVVLQGGTFRLGPGDRAALWFTLHQAIWSAALSVGFAIPLARALSRRQFRGRQALVILLGAPFILPVIVAVLGLLTVFGRGGWVSALLVAIGLEPLSIYGFHGVVLAHVFFNLPLATRLILQGWQAVPAEQFRLAGQLGLDGWTFFRVLEWPVLRKSVPGAFALIFVLCLTSFAVALTLGGGPRATTVELAIYEAFRFEFDLGRAAFLSLLQLAMAGFAAVIAVWLVPSIDTGRGFDRRQIRWDGRRARLRDAVIIVLGAAFLILPLLAIFMRGLPGLFVLPASIWSATLTSIWVAVLSVALMLALALPLAGWMAGRKRSGVETIGVLGLALSPLMIGTGAFLLINPFVDPRSAALPVTASVNTLMTLPFALRLLAPAIRDAVEGYGPLAQSIGVKRFSLWRILILPRLRPQIGFAVGLGMALSLGDLGVIALFADPERGTLPLAMYSLMGSYQLDAASGAALLLLLLALLTFWICDRLGRHAAAE
ncbi:MAG: thiamine/thiamine pyrophosphate ABC transporter permease ThiP [Pseudomonadota bacterium]